MANFSRFASARNYWRIGQLANFSTIPYFGARANRHRNALFSQKTSCTPRRVATNLVNLDTKKTTKTAFDEPKTPPKHKNHYINLRFSRFLAKRRLHQQLQTLALPKKLATNK
jgi:hypothetical protein